MLTGLEGTVCHADDILVFGSTRERHDHRLHRVLLRLQEKGLTLNNDKCMFAVDKVMFLGHIFSTRYIEADPGKLKAITKMPTPKDWCKKVCGHGQLRREVLSSYSGAHTAATRTAQDRHRLDVGESTAKSIQQAA